VGEGENTGGGPISDETLQCATADGRREWDKDAAAVDAIDKFLARANQLYGENHFYYREYGALLCEFSDGSIDIGPIIDGPYVGPPVGGQGTVDIPTNGCGAGTPVGFVHTHNSSNGVASLADIGYLQRLATEANANLARLSAYTITARTPPGSTDSVHRVSRTPFSDRDAIEEEGYEPEWVDPEATRCPESGG